MHFKLYNIHIVQFQQILKSQISVKEKHWEPVVSRTNLNNTVQCTPMTTVKLTQAWHKKRFQMIGSYCSIALSDVKWAPWSLCMGDMLVFNHSPLNMSANLHCRCLLHTLNLKVSSRTWKEYMFKFMRICSPLNSNMSVRVDGWQYKSSVCNFNHFVA